MRLVEHLEIMGKYALKSQIKIKWLQSLIAKQIKMEKYDRLVRLL